MIMLLFSSTCGKTKTDQWCTNALVPVAGLLALSRLYGRASRGLQRVSQLTRGRAVSPYSVEAHRMGCLFFWAQRVRRPGRRPAVESIAGITSERRAAMESTTGITSERGLCVLDDAGAPQGPLAGVRAKETRACRSLLTAALSNSMIDGAAGLPGKVSPRSGPTRWRNASWDRAHGGP